MIQEEKLNLLLNKERAQHEFKITIRFEGYPEETCSEAIRIAISNRYYMEEGTGKNRRIYASFYPEDVEDLSRLFDLVRNREKTRLYLNNKAVPYVQELWLFLMWFYRTK